MGLWWLQPGWKETRCGCGRTIWPKGDPDWGACFDCLTAELKQREQRQQQTGPERAKCDTCGLYSIVRSRGCCMKCEEKGAPQYCTKCGLEVPGACHCGHGSVLPEEVS